MIRTTDDQFLSRIDATPPASGASQLAERARLVLEIVPGERRLLPEFGCRLHHLPRVATLNERQVAAACVEEALERWVPGLGVDRAEVLEAERGSVVVRLRAGSAWHELRLAHRRSAPLEERREP